MNKGYNVYWDGVKKELKDFYSQTDFHMFINKIEYSDYNPKTNLMILSVPSNFIKDHVQKYKNQIELILTKISGYKCSINFTIDINNAKNKENVKIKQSKQANTKSKTSDKKEKKVKTNKIDDYSFDSFIIGNSNEFAAKAALAVAGNPGTHYNPYFVWGNSGLGKTHLLKAIEKHIKDQFPAKKVKYVTSEEFTNDFVNSLRSKSQEQFRMKYRKLDVLLLDDVQFFANKEGIQGEFFNTFNKLYDNFKQMVFSCDQPIKKVKNLEERLKSRFAMGIVVDLRPPDFELRMAILKNLAETQNLDIDHSAMEYICTNMSGNIRDLKGSFQILLAYSSIMKTPINLEIAKDTLKERLSGIHSSPISVDKIIQVVAEYFNLKSHEIIGVKRTKSIALARQIAMYISRKVTRLSTTQIGKYFGDKEHGTVMHATKKIEDMMNKDYKLKKDIETLLESISSE
jgi:chromosomal replication initiator protein